MTRARKAFAPVGSASRGAAPFSPTWVWSGAAVHATALLGEDFERDLWTQYAELGGVNGGNPAYIAALSNLDEDMPQYISDKTDDELSHAAFLNAYPESKGEAFRTLPSSKATGAKQMPRLTNLMNLDLDTSWYTRYRSTQNPRLRCDLPAGGEHSERTRDSPERRRDAARHGTASSARDTRGPAHASHREYRRIPLRLYRAGGASLYSTLALKTMDLEVLCIVMSISGVEGGSLRALARQGRERRRR